MGTTAEKSGLSVELKECVDAHCNFCWAVEVAGLAERIAACRVCLIREPWKL